MYCESWYKNRSAAFDCTPNRCSELLVGGFIPFRMLTVTIGGFNQNDRSPLGCFTSSEDRVVSST
ncbi:MAG: hypothetical protein LBG99_04285 [Propionibacteriaceae bacterium]|nr:hypothetical protein [Propionibacteriaceae bacterium]